MKQRSTNFSFRLLFTFLFILGLNACGGGGGDSQTPPTSPPTTPINLWTWMSGSDTPNQTGVYGTKGEASINNVPGARRNAISWTGSGDNLWLFGGVGYDRTGMSGSLNDLWKYDGTNWIWVSGSNDRYQLGVYDSMTAADNVPGSREAAGNWIDSNGNLWLFGGYGYDSVGTWNYLNDLWKYDGTNWTWVSGSKSVNQMGVYESMTPADNVPGARMGGVTWTDSNGNLWLFGGGGYDSTGSNGYLNDLWKYDGTNWAWVSGDKAINQMGVYESTTPANNVPGARYGAIGWKDSNDNLWLFGGFGYDSTGTLGHLNDLWKYDGSNWMWVSGSKAANQTGMYESTIPADNVPGARNTAVSWIDGNDNLWLFGGFGYDSVGTRSYLNDLWKYDGNNWIWVSGSNSTPNVVMGAPSVYGTKGVAAADNVPGARRNSTSWMDSSGNLWLFGGETEVLSNNLWRYQP
jgi:N-acetylneuraminic acid mutarotase